MTTTREKPVVLYRGSRRRREGPVVPILKQTTSEHTHTRPVIFSTERKDLAALFMFPLEALCSVGFEQDIAYICIWGTPEEFKPKDKGGFIYVLPEWLDGQNNLLSKYKR